MVKFFKTPLILFCIFIGWTHVSSGQGRDVMVFLKSGENKSGELLTVRDSVVVLLTAEISEDNDIPKRPEFVEFVFLKDIKNIEMQEFEVQGAVNGFFTGALIGASYGVIELMADKATYGLPSDNAPEFMTDVAIGAACGLVAGWAVATINSEDRETTWPSKTKGFLHIKKYARFSDYEPAAFADLIDKLVKETN